MTERPYLVFCGSQCALVWAHNLRHAARVFLTEWSKTHRGFAPPHASEMRVRRLRASDAAWIEPENSPEFVEALERVR